MESSSLEERLIDELGICGCGQPDVVLKHIQQVLHSIHTHESYAERKARLFADVPAFEYMTYYLLTDKEYLEHGGSVPGWLTGKGETLLIALNQWVIEEVTQ